MAPHSFDRYCFESLARQGREDAAAGAPERASGRFARALALWRGPVLADVRPGPLSSTHLVELEEIRKSVLERRVEADLQLGRHRELLDELGTLVSLHPLHENIHAQYMLALYRSGEPARALDVYCRLSRMLDETLGIAPAPRLRRLYDAVQDNDPALDAPTAFLTRTA
ncbi:AfsR/SARP family transcriptional regulator [Streptomyces sp. NPDC047097]|uniref:AfsR/SARP family transcriptional regulator n=1 Tax=Streptomyces sp. NPDC047097 TaxID=3155260 RepID=UPI00340F8092